MLLLPFFGIMDSPCLKKVYGGCGLGERSRAKEWKNLGLRLDPPMY